MYSWDNNSFQITRRSNNDVGLAFSREVNMRDEEPSPRDETPAIPSHAEITEKIDKKVKAYVDKLIGDKFAEISADIRSTKDSLAELVQHVKTNNHPNMQDTNNLLSEVAVQLTTLVSKFNDAGKSNGNEKQDLDRESEKSIDQYQSGRSTRQRGSAYIRVALIYSGPDVVENFADHLQKEIYSAKKAQEVSILKWSEVAANPRMVDGHICVFLFRRTSTRFVESLTGSVSPTPLELIQKMKYDVKKIVLIGMFEQYNGKSSIFSSNDKQVQDQYERNILQEIEEFPKYEIAFYKRAFYYGPTIRDHIFKQFL